MSDKMLSFAAHPGPATPMTARKGGLMKTCNSSMQLTRAADYALRVMIHLTSLQPHERALLPALAEATEAPESFLSKVLQELARARMITSRRGKSGGFSLLPRGRRATMREVIEAIDGPIRLNVCLTTGGSCGRKLWCPAHPVWVEAQQAMLAVLDRARIEELGARKACAPLQPSGVLAVLGQGKG
jgi:Rrf2 family protein